MQVNELITPALLINQEKLLNNIVLMASKAREGGVHLRPHIKTHKCLEIATLQYEHGANGITVSTPAEAEVFIDAGFSDVTLAYPVIPDKIPFLLTLAQRSSLKVLVDHPAMVTALEAECVAAETELDVLLKVDCGYHRCGVDPKSVEAITIAKMLNEKRYLRFAGILTHAGQSYEAKSPSEIQMIAKAEQEIMVRFARQLQKQDLKPNIVTIGSTPTAMATNQFLDGITEIRPGNYVFFDNIQVALGSCTLSDCALSVLTSIVSVQSDYVVVDAGATTLSKDMGPTHIVADGGYGVVYSTFNAEEPMQTAKLEKLAQEHGKIRFAKDSSPHNFRPGDQIQIIPNRCYLTANLFDQYYVTKGNDVIARWPIRRQRFATPFENE